NLFARTRESRGTTALARPGFPRNRPDRGPRAPWFSSKPSGPRSARALDFPEPVRTAVRARPGFPRTRPDRGPRAPSLPPNRPDRGSGDASGFQTAPERGPMRVWPAGTCTERGPMPALALEDGPDVSPTTFRVSEAGLGPRFHGALERRDPCRRQSH